MNTKKQKIIYTEFTDQTLKGQQNSKRTLD